MRISVIGLGKLGAPLAAVLAAKGNDVIGVDLNQDYVKSLSIGRAPVEEPQLQEFIESSRGQLRATVSTADAISETSITFVIVPTPSDSKGAFSNQYVLSAVREIGAALRKKVDYHIVVITSTVMPGTTNGEIRSALESSSGRQVGENLGLCYNPEFVALGSVIRNMLQPDVILIGESDTQAGDVLEGIYRRICDKVPPIRRMSFVNAEITKLAVNAFVTTKITYANMLSGICDQLAGADVDVITQTLGFDSRIGPKYMQGALGYGGPCFPRDNLAFALLAERVGARADLAESTHRLNQHQLDRLFAKATAEFRAGGVIGVLGLSYKPDTSVVVESQGLALVKRLSDAGYRVIAYDPMALVNARSVIGPCFEQASSAEECVRLADRVVITTAWPEFKDISTDAFRRAQAPVRVVDCWRLLDPQRIGSVSKIVYLGQGSAG